jgi:hypothetical protein
MKNIYLFVLLLTLGCKSNNPNVVAKFPQDPELKRIGRGGNLFDKKDGIVLFEDKNEKNISAEKNEKHQISLWENSFRVISQILPISIADQKSGLIITDWGNMKNDNNNLYKINVIISRNDFNKDNITLTVFKKLNNQKIIEDKEIKDIILGKIFSTK